MNKVLELFPRRCGGLTSLLCSCPSTGCDLGNRCPTGSSCTEGELPGRAQRALGFLGYTALLTENLPPPEGTWSPLKNSCFVSDVSVWSHLRLEVTLDYGVLKAEQVLWEWPALGSGGRVRLGSPKAEAESGDGTCWFHERLRSSRGVLSVKYQ